MSPPAALPSAQAPEGLFVDVEDVVLGSNFKPSTPVTAQAAAPKRAHVPPPDDDFSDDDFEEIQGDDLAFATTYEK